MSMFTGSNADLRPLHQQIHADSPAQCMDCGMPYEKFPLDVVVPDDQWRQLTGRNDGGGILCAACIVARAAKLPGVTVAKLTFSARYESRRDRRARERLEAKSLEKREGEAT